MRPFTRVKNVLLNIRRRDNRVGIPTENVLREFVYLDEVSVYSLLASRRGSIATEFSEQESASLSNEISGSIGVGLAGTGASLNSKLQGTQVKQSQVLRKATIQSSFKDLYESELNIFAIGDDMGVCNSQKIIASELEDRFDDLVKQGIIINPSRLTRGALFEVEVELETDPIYRLVAAMATISDIIEDTPDFFETEVLATLPEMRSAGRLIDNLLAGLVPIRGRLLDFVCINTPQRSLLVRRDLINKSTLNDSSISSPVFVVGVTQNDLFWKDIRRVLFSGASYNVFCRLTSKGLTNSWNPVKGAEVLAGIDPSFDEQLRTFGDIAHQAVTTGSTDGTMERNQSQDYNEQIVRNYANSLAEVHGHKIEPDKLDILLSDISLDDSSLSTIDDQRLIFDSVTRQIENEFAFKTSGDMLYTLRSKVLTDPHSTSDAKEHQTIPTQNIQKNEFYLDAEFIGIYW